MNRFIRTGCLALFLVRTSGTFLGAICFLAGAVLLLVPEASTAAG